MKKLEMNIDSVKSNLTDFLLNKGLGEYTELLVKYLECAHIIGKQDGINQISHATNDAFRKAFVEPYGGGDRENKLSQAIDRAKEIRKYGDEA